MSQIDIKERRALEKQLNRRIDQLDSFDMCISRNAIPNDLLMRTRQMIRDERCECERQLKALWR